MNVIEPTQTDWAFPVFFSTNKQGMLSFNVDYRNLGAVEVCDWYISPILGEYIDFLGDEQVLSTLDAKSGYW